MSSMAEGTTLNVTDGSGGGLVAFLGWTIEKSELVEGTASALRTGSAKVLSVEDDWEVLDLRSADLDAIVNRFKIKHRMDMKDRTREQYEQRFRQSVEMYLKWLDDDPTWKPAQRKRATSAVGAGGSKKVAAEPVSTPPRVRPEMSGERDPQPQAGVITYPFPIRPGLRGKIELPEDLTEREAKRIAAFIAALAVEQEVAPLGIEARRESSQSVSADQ